MADPTSVPGPPADPSGTFRRAWERKIGDPWCTQLFFGSGLTIPTSDGTVIPPWFGENYSSATIENFDEIDSQVQKLLSSQKLELVSDPAEIASLVVNPVGAANKKDRGVILPEKRFYLDCSRHVNFRLPHYRMSLPGYDDALNRLFPNAWLAKVDLSAAFLHIRVDPRYRRVLGFKWRDKYYRFTHMIFGLSTAPAIWQYSMDRVCDYLRSLGLNVIVYLDDFLLIADSEATCSAQLKLMYDELASLGLSVNFKKTLGPSQSIHYLGLEIDSVRMELRVPDYKLTLVRDQITQFRSQFEARGSAPLRSVLSLTGRLGHISRAVHASRPFLRRLWDLCCGLDFAHNTRHRHVTLPSSIWRDLDWWEFLLAHWNGVARWISGPDIIAFSDASNLGFGFHSADKLCHGAWPSAVRGKHINWKELCAIELSCISFAPSWSGHRVLFACDNETAVSIINSGSSRNPALAAIIRRIAMLAAIFGFDFRAVHIPGAENKLADHLSRLATGQSDASAWPSSYFDCLDPLFISLLSDLSSFRSLLFNAANSLASTISADAGASVQHRSEFSEHLQTLRQSIPDLEQFARSLRGVDPSGPDWLSLLPVPCPSGTGTQSGLQHDRCRQGRDPQPLSYRFVAGLSPRPRHHEGCGPHHCGTPCPEAPIPLEVVTPPNSSSTQQWRS